MGVIKKKPYEISIWEDRLVTEEDISYYKEIKLAVIGSDKMESPNRAFDPVLTENINGEKTLTFSLAYKYYDEYEGELVTNPFYSYLINERKVKLFYNNEWSEFVIKECEESSTENIFTYTAKELFSLELAKLGYNVTLNTELNNNQGTIIELAKQVLENTDWQVDEENSDLLVQFVQEPLYEAIITSETGINVLDLNTNEQVTIEQNETIYIFYSFINNQITDYVQFIREADRNSFFIDDDNVIKSTNYRIMSSVNYENDDNTGQIIIKIDTEEIARINGAYLNNQGYRLVYKMQTTYDPVMDRTVDIYQMSFKDGVKEIYHFLDYNYTTSDIVVSYITNGSNFQLFENGKIQGWYNTTPVSLNNINKRILQPISVTTYPELSVKGDLTLINELSEITGYLELKFNDILTNNYENTFFNQGFEHSRSIIDHVSKGEEFVLRTRYYTADEKHGELQAGNPVGENNGLRLIVAKYETVDQECYINEDVQNPSTIKAYKIIPKDIILDFNSDFEISPNVINSGIFSIDYKQYLVDNVVQVPSLSYIYKTEGNDAEYIWDPKQQIYILKNESFADYYLTTARAQYSFTNEEMDDPKFRMGIFLYTKDSTLASQYIYVEDIQLTRCYRDAENNIVTLGNVPTATSIEAHKYYLKPEAQKTEKDVTTYGSLDFLASELGINKDIITPVFNEESEKILSIQANNSNYFNILQDLCETFECWLDIRVEHEEDGSIKLDENYNPIKKVAFKEYAGKDNFAGFKNGINLTGITRNIDSNEIVTKLIVDPVQSEYTNTGSVDIQDAKSNPSGQAYILNLSYYINRGLITDVEQCNEDITTYNQKTKELNEQRIAKEQEYIQAYNSLTKISAQRNTYTALIEEAEKQYNEALEDFQKLTNWDYDAFVSKYQNIEEWARADENKDKDLLKNDTIMDVIGEIYVASVALNNYSGILTNLDKSYEELSLKCYGAKDYGITTVFIPGDESEITPTIKTQVTVDDYITGLYFQLADASYESTVLYHTTPNDRVFIASSAAPYKYIKFLQLPPNYNLKYFKEDGTEVIVGKDDLGINFQIYDDVAGESYDRRFILVPIEERKGLQQEVDDLIIKKTEVEKEFYKKYSRFLQEGTWSSQDYIDSELYYFNALQVSNTSAQPKVSYTIDVLEVSQIDGLENYDFRVGDKTYIEDPDFFGYLYQSTDIRETIEKDKTAPNRAPVNGETEYVEDEISQFGAPIVVTARSPVREEVIVSEVEWHFDEPDNNKITVQNYKTRFEDLFQRISATVQTVQRNEVTYPKTSSILDQSGLINSTLLADSLDGIGGLGFALTTNGSVAATEDGLLIRDLLNPANVMRLASSGLQVSTDGGVNWGTAINAEGISTDVLTAGTINTQKIWLMDGDNPSFRWDKAGLNAYGLDENGNQSYDLKTYVRFDKYGLYGIKNDENYVASSLDDVRNKAFFGITWDGFFIKNSYTDGEVSITSEDDFVVKQNNINRIKIGAVEKDSTGAPTKYGINIMNDDGEVVFDTGDDGNVTITGTINAQAGMFSGEVSVGGSNGTYILIDGASTNPTISSSNYADGASTGWIIDSNGDATFSNVSVRGAIKTAVFEYEEIQAVGGAFLFRPSSTIKTARYDESEIAIIDDFEYKTVSSYYDFIVVQELISGINPAEEGLYEEVTEMFAPTKDEEIISGKTYYQFSDNEYVVVTPEAGQIPEVEGWYEIVSIPPVYQPTVDTTVISGKNYYEKVYNNLIVTVEKPLMFRVNNWVKLSNYNEIGEEELDSYGLVHVYKVGSIDTEQKIEYVPIDNPIGNPVEQEFYEEVNDEFILSEDEEVVAGKTYYTLEITEPTYGIALIGGCAILDSVDISSIEGGALIDFGNKQQTQNYGIGINSSDNYVNLPARSISLFETIIQPESNIKVQYDYKTVLGTLPPLPYQEDGGLIDPDAKVSQLYDDYLKGTQGLFTDNIYLGDANQYLTFYTNNSNPSNPQKELKIRANKIEYELNGEYIDVAAPAKYIWYDSNGAHVASGNNETFDSTNPETFGYNSLMATNKLALRNNSDEYVFIDEDGLNINHISNGKSTLVATYGEKTIIGDKTKGVHIEIGDGKLSFRNETGDEVSYLDSNKLYIPYSVVLNEMIVGRDNNENPLWSWKVTDNHHLRLVWKGTE